MYLLGVFGSGYGSRYGKKRFGELKSSIFGISSKALTDTLRHLENRNILIREAHAIIPPDG
ncbi:winged helix-turn-helix transcriptional regulator [Cohnella ginsengisoli]|uniref:winged helix-turn-helix transcriptional regulator n=1 Tax=Cohnella ginsengisoli TaxID=425004 RepID=UPI003B8A7C14